MKATIVHRNGLKWSKTGVATVAVVLFILQQMMMTSFVAVAFTSSRRRVQSARSLSMIIDKIRHPPRRRISLYSERSDNSVGDWQLDNSFEQFLNQCSIQSLIFLINSLKDRHTALWLEDFTQPIIHSKTKEEKSKEDQTLSNMAAALNDAMHETQMVRPIKLLSYHGLGAINTTRFPTWDVYFEQLLQQPILEYTIESSRPHVPSYTLDIVPASLCSRLISVREQIAREFVNDLDAIAEFSLTVMETYYRQQRQSNNNNNNDKLERMPRYFLERNDYEDYMPSPLRKGNFDLLLAITTQEAIHRTLNRLCTNSNNNNKNRDKNDDDDDYCLVEGSPDSVSVQFLRNFYVQRIGSHFTGSNIYGWADDFLDELLQTLPRSVVQLQDSKSGLVDPERLLEMIFKVS